MTTSSQHRPCYAPWITAAIIASTFCGLVIWCIVGVTGFFRLSSETATLRASFMEAMPGAWNKKIALRVGWFTTGIARVGAGFFNLPPEPRAALAAVHGAEVGIYSLDRELAVPDGSAVLEIADKAMKARGWDRIVGVSQERQLVAVYWPHQKLSPGKIKCCVLVFQGRELIVSSVRGNLEPLMELASQHLDLDSLKRQLSAGI